jgi:hypothetical protein
MDVRTDIDYFPLYTSDRKKERVVGALSVKGITLVIITSEITIFINLKVTRHFPLVLRVKVG